MQQLYNCVVRLNGSMKNEVRLSDVTAAEIQVLKAIHNSVDAGVEVVYNIVRAGKVDRDDYEERERLTATYGRALAKIEGIKSLATLVGHETVPLSQSIRGVDTLAPPKTGRRAKPEAPAPEPEPEAIDATEFA
jgi:hypothetical protein